MVPMLLTQSNTFLLGPIAKLLGLLMNGIFWVLNKIGIPNTGLSIIFFTVIIYMALMPLTIKQQKFSKLSGVMQPELKKIQDRYKGKKDNDSMMKQNQEMQAVYKKYGVSPTGSCLQLVIQMPILFALYRVIYNIPAYVTKVKNAFFPLVTNLIGTSGSSEYLQGTSAAAQFAKQFTSDNFVNNVGDTVSNTFIDVLNRFSTAEWTDLAAKFPTLQGDITTTHDLLNKYNNFLGLNMGDTPWFTMRDAWTRGAYGLVIGAVLVPVLAAVTQWLNTKMMPTAPSTGDAQQDSMNRQMRTMNLIMPVMSAWFCFTLPAGMGLYWIAGAVIRTIQQIFINRRIDKMDIDKMVAENVKKQEAKVAKNAGRETVSQKMMQRYANMNTRSIEQEKPAKHALSDAEKKRELDKADKVLSSKKVRKNSMAARANLVSEYNDNQYSQKGNK